jgi:hypothetical protein
MARKIGLRVLRGPTVAMQVQIAPDAHVELKQIAKLRGVTPNTLARIVLELTARSPAFLAKLLDDDRIERNDHDEPLTVVQNVVRPDDTGALDPPMLTASALLQPQLVGVIH